MKKKKHKPYDNRQWRESYERSLITGIPDEIKDLRVKRERISCDGKHNVVIRNCTFKKCEFVGQVENITFIDCKFKSCLIWLSIANSKIINCDFDWESKNKFNMKITNCDLDGTHLPYSDFHNGTIIINDCTNVDSLMLATDRFLTDIDNNGIYNQ